LFYILSGTAQFEINGNEFVLNANQSIHIPPMTKHRIYNLNSSDLHFLVISEPESHGGRINC
jgi:mannose-6-phosphate isomerase-like protein (cupin superfamily)